MVAVITARGRKKPSKHRNIKTVVDGITFDSKKEARRYKELMLLLQAGKITNLELQKKYELIPKQRKSNGKLELACSYVADFVYIEGGIQVVEDVKGKATRDYIIKRKLMLKVHGIEIKEV